MFMKLNYLFPRKTSLGIQIPKQSTRILTYFSLPSVGVCKTLHYLFPRRQFQPAWVCKYEILPFPDRYCKVSITDIYTIYLKKPGRWNLCSDTAKFHTVQQHQLYPVTNHVHLQYAQSITLISWSYLKISSHRKY